MMCRFAISLIALLLVAGAQAQVNHSNYWANSNNAKAVLEATDAALIKYVQSPSLNLCLLSLREIERRKGTFADSTLTKIVATDHSKRSYISVPILRSKTKAMNKTDLAKLRLEAALTLGRLGSKSSLPTLRTAAALSDSKVKSGAIRSLGMLKDVPSIPIVLKNLGHREASVRTAALRACGGFKDERVNKALRKILDGKDEQAKPIALTYLAVAGDRAVIPKLQRLMQIGNTKPMNPVRQTAGKALLYIDEKIANKLVTDAMKAERADGYILISTHGIDFGWITYILQDLKRLEEFRQAFRTQAIRLLRGD